MLLKYHHHKFNLQLVTHPVGKTQFYQWLTPMKASVLQPLCQLLPSTWENVSTEVLGTWLQTTMDSLSTIFGNCYSRILKFVRKFYRMHYALETRDKMANSLWVAVAKKMSQISAEWKALDPWDSLRIQSYQCHLFIPRW